MTRVADDGDHQCYPDMEHYCTASRGSCPVLQMMLFENPLKSRTEYELHRSVTGCAELGG